ncbi:UNVERIFIED_CONTAM: hypothetical protein PYX00_005411 [Menopon gallinae]|uniref:Uncharacterized protein n=1 Tax=Menopon gallinae TaxID=328185 RepID=A0AAW2HS23_9NEOP
MADCFVEPLCSVEQSDALSHDNRDLSNSHSNDEKRNIDINTVGLPLISDGLNQSLSEFKLANGHLDMCNPPSPSNRSHDGECIY